MESIIKMNNITKKFLFAIETRQAFFSAIFWGMVAHGYFFANKLSFGDDNNFFFNVGNTLYQDRWSLEILYRLVDYLTISVSSSWFNGIVSLILLGLSSCFIIDTFEVKNKYVICLISGLIVSFPSIASIFAYMFTAPYYMGAIMCTCMALWMTKGRKLGYILATILLAFSLGIYQAFLGIYISGFVLILLMRLLDNVYTCKQKDFWKDLIRFMIPVIGGIVLYFFMDKIVQMIVLGKTVGYGYELSFFLKSIKNAYKCFGEFLYGGCYLL